MPLRIVNCSTRFWKKTEIREQPAEPYLPQRKQKEVANRLGYPVLVRPSYVLGGQGMQIALTMKRSRNSWHHQPYAQDHPILVDKYLQGKEIEVDAVCDGEDILIPGIMEHIERTGSPFRRQYFRISGSDDQ